MCIKICDYGEVRDINYEKSVSRLALLINIIRVRLINNITKDNIREIIAKDFPSREYFLMNTKEIIEVIRLIISGTTSTIK